MAGEDYRAAAAKITAAQGLIITAGAGMGVDSGLPDAEIQGKTRQRRVRRAGSSAEGAHSAKAKTY